MELGSRIRQLRTKLGISQDQLADSVFVTRQTVSNWENDKTYPDIKSLLLLSQLFSVSLDTLVKGDIEKMKVEISKQEYASFQMDSNIFAALLIALVLTPIPLGKLLGWLGLAAYLAQFAVTMCFALRLERFKKKYDIQTYKELIAFTEGKDLTEIEKARESGKRAYQKALAFLISAVIGAVLAGIMILILK